ncbi:sigma factor-like helix-turn-helix DNA-binding protein [Streptomyces venezuelae]|uniref:sigma factor-like helix-turn-helix DNA-binding protein n=1 Tax=Streptomyces venezuelae TaxID=54571 RepID=UPI003439342D
MRCPEISPRRETRCRRHLCGRGSGRSGSRGRGIRCCGCGRWPPGWRSVSGAGHGTGGGRSSGTVWRRTGRDFSRTGWRCWSRCANSPHQAQIVVLHHLLALPVEQVARETGATNGAVRTWRSRTCRVLGEHLIDSAAFRTEGAASHG